MAGERLDGTRRGTRRLRERNRAEVLAALTSHGPTSRAALARRLGLSATTASSIVTELVADGLAVITETAATGGRGRPARLVALTTPPGVLAGIDIGRRHLRVALADMAEDVLAERFVEVPAGQDREVTTRAALVVLDDLFTAAASDRRALRAVGIGLPGPVEIDTGLVTTGSILPEWVGYDIVGALREQLRVPVALDNDANLGALGEWRHGAARGERHGVYIKVATGIGCGLVLDGELYRGAGGAAGELGHTPVDPEGEVCRCGSRGCLETVASVPALLEMLRPALGHDVTLDEVLANAAAGDRACRRALTDLGRNVGRGAAILSNLLNPDVVVVGGPLIDAGPLFFDAIGAALASTAVPSTVARLAVRAAELGPHAEITGALVLARQVADAHRPAGPASSAPIGAAATTDPRTIDLE